MLAGNEMQVADAGVSVFRQLAFLLRRQALPEGLEFHSETLYRNDKVYARRNFSPLLIYQRDKEPQNARAMEINQIRRENLREEARKLGGQAKLAAKLDKSESEISQLIGKSPIRNIGTGRARTFERALGLKRGALDVAPDTGEFQHSEIMREIGKILTTKDADTQRDFLEILRRIK